MAFFDGHISRDAGFFVPSDPSTSTPITPTSHTASARAPAALLPLPSFAPPPMPHFTSTPIIPNLATLPSAPLPPPPPPPPPPASPLPPSSLAPATATIPAPIPPSLDSSRVAALEATVARLTSQLHDVTTTAADRAQALAAARAHQQATDVEVSQLRDALSAEKAARTEAEAALATLRADVANLDVQRDAQRDTQIHLSHQKHQEELKATERRLSDVVAEREVLRVALAQLQAEKKTWEQKERKDNLEDPRTTPQGQNTNHPGNVVDQHHPMSMAWQAWQHERDKLRGEATVGRAHALAMEEEVNRLRHALAAAETRAQEGTSGLTRRLLKTEQALERERAINVKLSVGVGMDTSTNNNTITHTNAADQERIAGLERDVKGAVEAQRLAERRIAALMAALEESQSYSSQVVGSHGGDDKTKATTATTTTTTKNDQDHDHDHDRRKRVGPGQVVLDVEEVEYYESMWPRLEKALVARDAAIQAKEAAEARLVSVRRELEGYISQVDVKGIWARIDGAETVGKAEDLT